MPGHTQVHPASPTEAASDSLLVAVAPSPEDFEAVLGKLRFHVRHARFRGLGHEQLFRHFARSLTEEGTLGHSTAESAEITPALLHHTLLDLHIPSTAAIAKALVTRYSDGGCGAISHLLFDCFPTDVCLISVCIYAQCCCAPASRRWCMKAT